MAEKIKNPDPEKFAEIILPTDRHFFSEVEEDGITLKNVGIGWDKEELTIIYPDNNRYSGRINMDGETCGKGKYTVINEETKEPLCTQVYDEKGIMKSVEYPFKDKDKSYKMVIDYDGINIALNRDALNENKIKNIEDLKEYISVFICDENDKKIENLGDHDGTELIKKCAQYQMRTLLKDKDGKLNDRNRIDYGGYTGLQNLIVLAELSNDINALKRTRFEIEQNNPKWPKNIFISTNINKSIELYLNSLGLTINNPSENNNLVSINSLDTDYFSINMTTTTGDHGVSGIIDLSKLKKNRKDFIYVYDSSRIIDIDNRSEKKGNLGIFQFICQSFNHEQQQLGSCWYNACCSTITAAEHPEIIEKIRGKEGEEPEIKPIPWKDINITDNTEFNDFELLQMLKLQEVAKDLKIKRLRLKKSIKTKQGPVKFNKRPRTLRQIVNKPTRNKIKEEANKYLDKNTNLKHLKGRLSTYEALLVVCFNKGLKVNELTPRVKKILSKESARMVKKKSTGIIV